MDSLRATRTSLAVVAALLVAACGGGDDAASGDDGTGAATATEAAPDPTAGATTDPPGSTPTDDATGGESAGAAVTVATADSSLGTILVDGEGRTLYLFDNDSDGTSVCEDACAQTWPPVVGEASVSGDADASLLGTTTRSDGSTQVTYDGSPLYLYAADTAPGDTNGQGVGDIWWVVAPDGSPITGEEATATGREGY